jgi:hypothetical protein
MATTSPFAPRWTWEQIGTALKALPHSQDAEVFLDHQLHSLERDQSRTSADEILQEILFLAIVCRDGPGQAEGIVPLPHQLPAG